MIIPRSLILKMRNIADRMCREHQNTHFMFNDVSYENRAI